MTSWLAATQSAVSATQERREETRLLPSRIPAMANASETSLVATKPNEAARGGAAMNASEGSHGEAPHTTHLLSLTSSDVTRDGKATPRVSESAPHDFFPPILEAMFFLMVVFLVFWLCRCISRACAAKKKSNAAQKADAMEKADAMQTADANVRGAAEAAPAAPLPALTATSARALLDRALAEFAVPANKELLTALIKECEAARPDPSGMMTTLTLLPTLQTMLTPILEAYGYAPDELMSVSRQLMSFGAADPTIAAGTATLMKVVQGDLSDFEVLSSASPDEV